MTTDFEALASQALQLPIQDQIALLRKLTLSFEKLEDVDPLLLTKVAKLQSDFESGLNSIPALAMLTRELNQNRANQ